MRVLVRALRPHEAGLRELASCPDTHDRGVAWSWSLSAVVGDERIEEVLVTTEESTVEASSDEVTVQPDPLCLEVPAGQEVVLVAAGSGIDVAADDGWCATLAVGDVLVSDGEAQRALVLSSPAATRLHVVRLRWKDGRPMRWVP